MARNVQTAKLFDAADANGDSDVYEFGDPAYNILPDKFFFVVNPDNSAGMDLTFQARIDGIWVNLEDPTSISEDSAFIAGPFDVVPDAVKAVISSLTAGDVTVIMRAFKF